MRQLKITKQITNRDTKSLEKYFQEISKIDLITAEEEVELAKRIREGDQIALNKLVNANLRFVVSAAKQYQGSGIRLSDLINEGNIGLVKAAKRFDETRGFKFISYAVWWIRQSILQAMSEQSRMVRLPLNKIGEISKIRKVYSSLEQAYQRPPSAVEIAKEATARVILTGTPVPNGYEDLYNLYRFIYPFKYQDILQIHYGQLKEMTKNTLASNESRVKQFINNINPYFIRIKKSDLELPEAKETTIMVKMDEHQREIYDFIEGKYIPQLSQNIGSTLKGTLNKAKLIRLRQAATNPALLLKSLKDTLDTEDPDLHVTEIYNESIDDFEIFQKIVNYNKIQAPQKFQEVKNLIETDILPNNGKVIIWTIFVQNADELQTLLEQSGIKTKLLIGRVPQEEREYVVKNFNNPEHNEFQVVIANPFSVSESISLHKACHNAIYLERDYNAANFLQSKDRIHRVGLPDGVETNYYYFISEHSIDSVIDDRLNTKVERMEKIIDEEIPLFNRIKDDDDTEIITALLKDYAQRA